MLDACLRGSAIKTIFTAGPSLTLRVVFFSLLSVLLMVLDQRFNHLGSIRSGIAVALYPVQYVVNAPFATGAWVSETFSSHESLLKDNQELRTENLLLKAQQQKMLALKSENIRLRELMHSTEKVGERVLISELLSVDLDPFTRQIVVNKGESDGVYVGQPLLDAKGVVGQVIETSLFSSRAMMIADPSHGIPVQFNRTGMRAIAVGTGAIVDSLELPHIPNNADIVEGDLLVTSGLGGRFPAGYPVAKVTHITIDPTQPYATVKAQPVADLERIREVLLVWREEDQKQGGERE